MGSEKIEISLGIRVHEPSEQPTTRWVTFQALREAQGKAIEAIVESAAADITKRLTRAYNRGWRVGVITGVLFSVWIYVLSRIG